MATKAELRRVIRDRRAALPDSVRRDADVRRSERTLAALRWLRPACVAAYWAVAPEPDTAALIDALARAGVEILLPVVTPAPGESRRTALATPRWAVWRGRDYVRASWAGFLEPTGPVLPGSALQRAGVAILPGLAGTRDGRRLGQGGGWYDRVLAVAPGVRRWLLLYADEVVDELPADPWDQGVDAIVTEEEWIDVPRG